MNLIEEIFLFHFFFFGRGEQLLWMVEELIVVETPNIDTVVRSLLAHVRPFDVSERSAWLISRLVHMIDSHKQVHDPYCHPIPILEFKRH
jgi:hypothetical protein